MTKAPIGSRATRSARIRSQLGHPVVDADGHWIETAPVMKEFFLDYVKNLGGSELAARFEAAGGLDYDDTVLRPWGALSAEQRRSGWVTRPPWWTLPAANTLDRATAHLPGLLAERLDDFGIDFAVLYPSRTLTTPAIREDELRQIACRALNVYHAELYGGHRDRMTPVAMIPMHTPEEAIAEVEYAVNELGLKAIMINGLIHRPIGEDEVSGGKGMPNWGSGSGERIDCLGLDSAYDYDPFWAKCVELKVAPASHTPGMGWGSRRSISSYVANHIGSFGASMEALCRGLFLGGVTRRFPELSFGMLEGGVSWACELYAGLVSHWEKRNAASIHELDPARIDGELLLELFDRYGNERMTRNGPAIADSFKKLEPVPPLTDEYAACEITRKEDIRDLFIPRFYFGCEADDGMVAWAFDSRINPMGAQLRAMFSSDMGHWDVPEMSGILEEAYELVEKGLVDEEGFRDFVMTNPIRFYTSVNPDFFADTRIAEAASMIAKES
ncbi:MAG: amidohydrolase family protein [Myxococcota bacterium]|jgi:predicted TIM-barrel fold metal-dependent hydrolase|nr:amidohydrolase family protein [Myxococcota bacterium]